MMKFTVLSCSKGDYYFRVHKTGCQDIKLATRQFMSDNYEVEAENIDEAIAAEVKILQDDDMGYFDYHFDAAPCTKVKVEKPFIEYPNGNKLTVFGVLKK